FRALDRGKWRAQQADAVTLQNPSLGKSDGQVEPRLPAQGGQEPVGSFPLDHLGGKLQSERLQVHLVGDAEVGHDGGRVGVDQDHLDALFAQGLARLGPRVVKLRRLADDDGSRPDHHHPSQVALLGHSDTHSSAACSSMLRAWSISSSLTMSGGKRRSTRSAMTLTRIPRFKQAERNWLPAALSSTPSISPRPRTSPNTSGRRRLRAIRPSRSRSPAAAARCSTPSSKSASSTAKPARAARKLPPKVEAWVPGSKARATRSVAKAAPMGTPPPRPFARVQMSACTP